MPSRRSRSDLQRRAMFRRMSQDQVLSAHDKLVHSVAKRYRAQTNYPDLVQEGRIGLLTAARKYDPKKAAFSTYARRHIQARVQRALGQGFQVRVPEKKLKTAQKPQLAVLSEKFDVAHEGGIAQAHAKASVSQLRKRIVKLPTRQMQVMLKRYYANGHARGEPWTTRKVGKALKISQGRVSQLERAARKRLHQGQS